MRLLQTVYPVRIKNLYFDFCKAAFFPMSVVIELNISRLYLLDHLGRLIDSPCVSAFVEIWHGTNPQQPTSPLYYHIIELSGNCHSQASIVGFIRVDDVSQWPNRESYINI